MTLLTKEEKICPCDMISLYPLTCGPHVVYDSVQLIWCVIKDIVIHRSVLILCFIRLKTPRG